MITTSLGQVCALLSAQRPLSDNLQLSSRYSAPISARLTLDSGFALLGFMEVVPRSMSPPTSSPHGTTP